MLEYIGLRAIHGAVNVGTLTIQLWRALASLPRALPIVGSRRRWQTAVQQMMAIGVSALPVAAAMSFALVASMETRLVSLAAAAR
jgi:hypothetical protein